ncbi:hypothetical protein [Flavobacterium sp.]|uniref:hypothetical protein n=1 Tax=Flavobacterium sp. TaxID=239 RepID=UPI002B4B7998|nr:hypothetical protein [Flavobacterium sp.]HLF51425.1 hypothetical protein [Flavobacterium sp.]
MSQMYHYATVSEALNELNEKGFTIDFNLHEEDIKKNPHQYQIEHVYRYEGNTDPGDEAVVYGIKSSSGQKGVFVAGFSANSDNDAARVLNELSTKGREIS